MRIVFTFIVILIAVPWTVAFTCVGYTSAKNNTGWSRCLGVFGAGLAIIGGIGFFGTALASLGMFGWLPRTFEWPMGYVRGVVTTEAGLHVVAHSPSSRIQIYDNDWSFRTGWFVDGRGGPIKICRAEGNEIEIVANHSRHRFVYDMTGELLSSSSYLPLTYDDFAEIGISRFVPTRPWLVLFSHPLASFAAAMCGMVLSNKGVRNRTRRKAK